MARIPRWAEKLFSARCSLGDAVASRPDEDINGWDYFVEFPHTPFDGELEKSPPRRQAFAQVKSTIGRSRRPSVKLSNMLTACNSPDPWFIFLVQKTGEIYGIEVLDDLLSRSLKEIRRARLGNAKLHKVLLPIEFAQKDRIDGDVVEWMAQRLGQSTAAYAQKKKEQFETSGYEHGYGTGKIVVSAKDEDEFTNNFIGLGKGLAVESFAYSDNRFGLPDLKVVQNTNGTGRIFFDPLPIGSCDIKLIGPASEPPLALKGSVFGFPPPMANTDETIRFSSPPLEVIKSGGSGRFILKNDDDVPYDLNRYVLHAKLLRWLHSTAIKMEVRSRGVPVWQARFRQNSGKIDKAFADIIHGLRSIGAHTDLSGLQFSIDDLKRAQPDLHEAMALLTESNLRLEATASGFGEDQIDAVLYLSFARLRGALLSVIATRPVTSSSINGDLRRLILGPPTIKDAYFISDATEDDDVTMLQEFNRHAKATADEAVLLIPDMMERLAETRADVTVKSGKR
ncbi:hypothetical protein [Neorhizobium tomejilense]|uniref:hypothetical protein n=1 Tax=Neorhizobium tomejilense TaxID=2093828 RepID=UPI00155F46BE|nr:hypothetical protein [Neorhizobium tomejilense]